jgi:hypothetical protein
MPIRRLSMMGSGHGGADHLDLIAKHGNRSEILLAMLDYLKRDIVCDLIQFENVSENSETLQMLKDLDQTSSLGATRLIVKKNAVCPQIDLTAGWQKVLGQCRRRSNFVRKRKKAEKERGFEFRSVTMPEEIQPAFERFLRLHNMRWDTDGGSELSGHPRLVSFQRQLISALSTTGLLRFDELWIDGECCGSVYGLDNGRTFYYYNAGYDSDYSNLSVGLILLGLSIKNAIERGNVLYDFLRGDETYKFDWADSSLDLVTIGLNSNSPGVLAHEFAGLAADGIRELSKFAMPTGLKRKLGTWRSSIKRNYQLSGQEPFNCQ